jgi:hypothetical protein
MYAICRTRLTLVIGKGSQAVNCTAWLPKYKLLSALCTKILMRYKLITVREYVDTLAQS